MSEEDLKKAWRFCECYKFVFPFDSPEVKGLRGRSSLVHLSALKKSDLKILDMSAERFPYVTIESPPTCKIKTAVLPFFTEDPQIASTVIRLTEQLKKEEGAAAHLARVGEILADYNKEAMSAYQAMGEIRGVFFSVERLKAGRE